MQSRIPRFPLSSEQCELLLAFETAGSLAELAELWGRDISVVSRQLKNLAEVAPVIEKDNKKWILTNLGRLVIGWAKEAVLTQTKMIHQAKNLRFSGPFADQIADRAMLTLVGVQTGFDHPSWGRRNNPNAEHEMAKLLHKWRSAGRPVAHIQHCSKEEKSPLRMGSPGETFKDFALPRKEEVVIRKNSNSAFINTNFEQILKARGCETLVLIGFSTHHCIDATARMAADLGFNVFIVSDAAVAFDKVTWDGKHVEAELVHQSSLANLSQEFASILTTDQLSELIDSSKNMMEDVG